MKNASFLEAVTSNRTAYCFYAGERVLFGRANEIFEEMGKMNQLEINYLIKNGEWKLIY